MVKTSVLWWLLVSALGFANAALADAGPAMLESTEDLRSPKLVVHFVRSNQTNEKRAEAQKALEFGLRAKRSKNWSLACKMFGESAIRHPSSSAILEYSDACLRMTGELRAPSKYSAEQHRADMAYFLGFYESVQAVNAQAGELALQEAQRVTQFVSCLKEFNAQKVVQVGCPPVKYLSGSPDAAKSNN